MFHYLKVQRYILYLIYQRFMIYLFLLDSKPFVFNPLQLCFRLFATIAFWWFGIDKTSIKRNCSMLAIYVAG